jgi:hypothetical protein
MQLVDEKPISLGPDIATDPRDPKLNLLFQPQVTVGVEHPGRNKPGQLPLKKLTVLGTGDSGESCGRVSHRDTPGEKETRTGRQTP